MPIDTEVEGGFGEGPEGMGVRAGSHASHGTGCAVSAVPVSIPDAANWSPISELEALTDEMFARWDTDQRAGKVLLALGGYATGYSGRTDSVRLACAVAPGLLSTVGAVHILTRRKGAFAAVDAETMLRNIAEMTSPEELARMFADMPAQAIEARRAETREDRGSVEDESAVPQGCAPTSPGNSPNSGSKPS